MSAAIKEKTRSNTRNDRLSNFGFSFEKGGAHSARTMMYSELAMLLDYVGSDSKLSKEEFVRAIQEDNCLRKRSIKTRVLSTRHLIDLYSLDPEITLFKGLVYFWSRDQEARPLLALLCAYSRDPILRSSASFILTMQEGEVATRAGVEGNLEETFPERFRKTTLTSTARNINSTWTTSRHLLGKARKHRSRATATAGAAAYALLLSYLSGARGEALFTTEYAKILDCSAERQIELAIEASRRGWLVFKRVGNVMEVLFPKILTKHELEWTREQD